MCSARCGSVNLVCVLVAMGVAPCPMMCCEHLKHGHGGGSECVSSEFRSECVVASLAPMRRCF